MTAVTIDNRTIKLKVGSLVNPNERFLAVGMDYYDITKPKFKNWFLMCVVPLIVPAPEEHPHRE